MNVILPSTLDHNGDTCPVQTPLYEPWSKLLIYSLIRHTIESCTVPIQSPVKEFGTLQRPCPATQQHSQPPTPIAVVRLPMVSGPDYLVSCYIKIWDRIARTRELPTHGKLKAEAGAGTKPEGYATKKVQNRRPPHLHTTRGGSVRMTSP